MISAPFTESDMAGLTQGPGVPSAPPRDAILEARIARILDGMTLAQKVGQMTQPDIRWITPDEVRAYRIGSVLNGGGAWPRGDKHASLADWLALARAYEAAALATDLATSVPLLWGTDAVHGHSNLFGATVFPHNIGLGATGDEALVREIGAATARAVRASGIGWTFAPTLAVVRDARWGRTYESYSEAPGLVARLGRAAVEGLQGTLGADDSVLACAKHYIGDGGTEGGRDQGINRATGEEMFRSHGAGYASALAAGVQTVMASFNSWQETDTDGKVVHDHGKLHGSRHLLTEVLKERWGFDGLVVSDWNGVGQVAGCSNSRCAAALNAGIDMVMVPEQWREFIADTIALVEAGDVPLARIDDAVSRILRVKLRAGLFEQASSQGRWAGRPDALAARTLARRAVRQSLVLLKNNAGVLPLARSNRLLVVGKSADSLQNQTGGWTLTWQGTGNANSDFPAGHSVLAGLRQALGDDRVVFSATAEGVDLAGFDAVIAVLGETPYAEGAGDIPPPGTLHHTSRHPEDLAVLQRVAGRGVPVITLLLAGRPLV
ncbi:MAG: glycoside hydrolase family 3 C-terminal domain-containing protein, partial [Rubrivivax sp.]|nr:glycoside hydrolase family 3 C-terminal domain-containing protein [Rubrivivax sp.]